MKKLVQHLFIAFLFCSSFISCNKSSSDTNSQLSIFLTDAPANYDAVNIDVQGIQVNTNRYSSTSTGWISLPLNKRGIYNLLDFRNGLDTLLASQKLPAGSISQIRLILGNKNSLSVDGTNHALSTPSSLQSGLKLDVHVALVEGIEYKIWLDFDAGRSIVVNGNKYILKPVIRAYTKLTSGAIKGSVQPDSNSKIYAIRNTKDTIGSAITDIISGDFFIGGLTAGKYKIAIDANNNYRDSTITTSVTNGMITDIGSIQLTK